MKRKGAVIAGTSAGTSCQTDRVMIMNGVSWDALKDGAHETESSEHPDDLIYQRIGGIGLFHGYVLDSHFSQRGRQGRMIRLLWDTRKQSFGSNFAFGVDEDTALVVTHDGTNQATGKVIGSSGVTLLDISKAADMHSKYFSIHGVSVSYLTQGDQINLHTRAITIAPNKMLLAGHEMYDHALTSADIFAHWDSDSDKKPEFVRVATSIYDSRNEHITHGTTNETNPTFKVKMSVIGHDSVGWVDRKPSRNSDLISFTNLQINIDEA